MLKDVYNLHIRIVMLPAKFRDTASPTTILNDIYFKL